MMLAGSPVYVIELASKDMRDVADDEGRISVTVKQLNRNS
jgi:hypothetical protein